MILSPLVFPGQNIDIKTLLKPKNTYNKPCLENDYLNEKCKNLLVQKVALNVAISFGPLHLFI
jgi:hypothetical protein